MFIERLSACFTMFIERLSACLELAAILRMKCCRNYCLHHISRIDASKARTAFQDKTMADQRHWMLKYLLEHHNTDDGTINFQFFIGTTQLCKRGWRLVLGITRTRLWKTESDMAGKEKSNLTTFCICCINEYK